MAGMFSEGMSAGGNITVDEIRRGGEEGADIEIFRAFKNDSLKQGELEELITLRLKLDDVTNELFHDIELTELDFQEKTNIQVWKSRLDPFRKCRKKTDIQIWKSRLDSFCKFMKKCPKVKKVIFIGEISKNEEDLFKQEKTIKIMCIMFPPQSGVTMIAKGGITMRFFVNSADLLFNGSC